MKRYRIMSLFLAFVILTMSIFSVPVVNAADPDYNNQPENVSVGRLLKVVVALVTGGAGMLVPDVVYQLDKDIGLITSNDSNNMDQTYISADGSVSVHGGGATFGSVEEYVDTLETDNKDLIKGILNSYNVQSNTMNLNTSTMQDLVKVLNDYVLTLKPYRIVVGNQLSTSDSFLQAQYSSYWTKVKPYILDCMAGKYPLISTPSRMYDFKEYKDYVFYCNVKGNYIYYYPLRKNSVNKDDVKISYNASFGYQIASFNPGELSIFGDNTTQYILSFSGPNFAFKVYNSYEMACDYILSGEDYTNYQSQNSITEDITLSSDMLKIDWEQKYKDFYDMVQKQINDLKKQGQIVTEEQLKDIVNNAYDEQLQDINDSLTDTNSWLKKIYYKIVDIINVLKSIVEYFKQTLDKLDKLILGQQNIEYEISVQAGEMRTFLTDIKNQLIGSIDSNNQEQINKISEVTTTINTLIAWLSDNKIDYVPADLSSIEELLAKIIENQQNGVGNSDVVIDLSSLETLLDALNVKVDNLNDKLVNYDDTGLVELLNGVLEEMKANSEYIESIQSELKKLNDSQKEDSLFNKFVDFLADRGITAMDNVFDYVLQEMMDTKTKLFKLKNTLKERFPTCVFFDLVTCINLFAADPVTPAFDLPIKYQGINEVMHIDLEKFDDLAAAVRTVISLIWVVVLIKITMLVTKKPDEK